MVVSSAEELWTKCYSISKEGDEIGAYAYPDFYSSGKHKKSDHFWAEGEEFSE